MILFKMLLVYGHLLAAGIAIGVLFMQDLSLAKWRGRAMSQEAIADLRTNSTIVTLALALLWITGIVIVGIGYAENAAYILNEKLWVKVVVVCALTLNGLFLHYYSFPRLASPEGFLATRWIEQFLVMVTGAVSLVSWLYACYLGIARPWNNTEPFSFVLGVYGICLLIALMIGYVCWQAVRREQTANLSLNS
jgi:hypothetical protein